MYPIQGSYIRTGNYNPQQQGNAAGFLQGTGNGLQVTGNPQQAGGNLQVTDNPQDWGPAMITGHSQGGIVGQNSAINNAGGGWGAAARAAAAQYDQSIGNTQKAIDRLGSQLNSGFSSIDASYQNALNQLLLGKNRAEKQYGDTKLETGKNYVAGKNTIGANAGNTLNSLQRLLGMRGAGGSSAANISAPQAVGRQATLQRNDLSNTYGSNVRGLETNWNNYLTDYGNQVEGSKSQREQQRQGLQSQIDSNRASLLQTLAQLAGQKASALGGNAVGAAQPYLDQANAVLDRTANYVTAPINYAVKAYEAPSLEKYTVNPNAAPTVQGQSAANDYFSPYLAALLGKRQTNLAG